MKCNQCGKDIYSSDRYCSNCGENNDNYVISVTNEIEETVQPFYNKTAESVTNIYIENQQPQVIETSTFGVLAIVFGALGGFLGLVFGIIGLSTYKNPSNRRNCGIGIGLWIAWMIILFAFS